MKIIRRTRIKIKQKEFSIVKNEKSQICPFCNIPIQQNALSDGEDFVEQPKCDEQKEFELPANTEYKNNQ